MSKLSEKINERWNKTDGKTRHRVILFTYSFIALFVIVGLVFMYNSPSTLFEAEIINTDKTSNSAIIDKTREVDLASIVAAEAHLSVENNVSERAISIYAKNKISQADDTVITKPTLSISSGNSSLTTYVANDGDNTNTVADKFGLTAQTVKWANNLVSDDIAVGTSLTIPVVDGVIHVVQNGESLESLTAKYGSSPNAILAQNNIDLLSVGETILIPDGILPENERPGRASYTATIRAGISGYSSNYRLSIGTSYAGNNYSYGYCTWYAYNRRVELRLPAYRSLGNANTWDDRARAAGITVSRIPIAGAIFQTDSGYYGHVGIVESVNPDGSINISDMNGIAGWGRRGMKDGVSPSGYWFIY